MRIYQITKIDDCDKSGVLWIASDFVIEKSDYSDVNIEIIDVGFNFPGVDLIIKKEGKL